MRSFIISIVCVVAGFQVQAIEWSRDIFPNPSQDAEACRSSYPRICDPDSLLGTKDMLNLSERINTFETMVSLPSCSKHNDAPLQLAVAIVDKMDLRSYFASGKVEAAKEMAMGIHDDWGVGFNTPCGGTGILVFLSIKDRQVFISTGAAVQKVLTDGRLDNVIAQMGDVLRRQENGDAIIRGIDEMETFIKEGPPSAWPILILGGGIFSFILYNVFQQHREKRRYAEARSQLSKLDRDRALALQGQYECNSCAICLADFQTPSTNAELHPLTSSSSSQGGNNSTTTTAVREEKGSKKLPTIGSDGLPLKLLRCGHCFDTTCWNDWIGSGHGDPTKCPICKQDVGGSPPPTSPEPSAPPLETQNNNHHLRANGRNNAYPMMGQSVYDMFELERAFRLGRLSTRYPRFVSPRDVQRWSQRGYDASLANDPTFAMSNPAHQSAHRSGGSRSAGGSFGGGHSSGGRGGTW